MLSKEHRANIEAAIKETEYKYFGMYEFTESQQDAVSLLVSVAQAMLDDDAARRTVSGQEAVAVVGPRIGDLMANPIRWTDMKAMDSLPIGTKLYAAPIPRTVSGQEAERDVRDFQRELAQYFEDVGDPHGAVMIRNFADLSGYAAPIPATEKKSESS